jgi:iron(III) transport system substrate-binding protein
MVSTAEMAQNRPGHRLATDGKSQAAPPAASYWHRISKNYKYKYMETMLNSLRLKFILPLFLIAIGLPAWAADPQQSIQALAAYKGADRQQKLVAAAQKEGTLTLYTSIAADIGQLITSDFEAKYGVKVKLWRSGDRTVLQRILSERTANHPTFDVVHMASTEMEMAHREKTLASFKSPAAGNLIPGAVSANNEYVATFVNVLVQAYNTNSVKKADLPKTYQDLLDPKWKGRLGIEATDEEWFYELVMSMGEQKGLQYFRDLTATNKPSLRNGHTLLGNLVTSAEVPLGLNVFAHTVISAKKLGAPIDYTLLQPIVASSYSMGISSQVQHPNAALLFYEYMLTDGQKIFASHDYAPTNKDIDSPFRNVRYLLTSQPAFIDQYDKWEKLWQDIVVMQK